MDCLFIRKAGRAIRLGERSSSMNRPIPLSTALQLALLVFCHGCRVSKGENVSRKMLQESVTLVEIAEDNVEKFAAVVGAAEPNSVIRISADIQLPSMIPIGIDGLTFRGNKSAVPTILCALGEGGFEIRSTSVAFKHLIIKNCTEAAIRVLKPPTGRRGRRGNDEEESSGMDLEMVNVAVSGASVIQKEIFSTGPSAAVTLDAGTRTLVDKCKFSSNNGTSGGAIFFTGDSLIIRRTTFSRNTAENSGGAIYASRPSGRRSTAVQLKVEESLFENNVVLIGTRDGIGRAQWMSVDSESTSFIEFVEPAISGGAISANGLDIVNIKTTDFSGNNAAAAGGALYINDVKSIVLDRSNFTNNWVNPISDSDQDRTLQHGGAAFVSLVGVESDFRVSSSVFANNRAWYGGALHVVGPSGARTTFQKIEFFDNRAVLGGGALAIRNIDFVQISSSFFKKNQAISGGAILLVNGARIELNKGPAHLFGNRFHENTAVDGGAIFAIGATGITGERIDFANNRVRRNGGAICFIHSVKGIVDLSHVQFVGNSAKKGGAIFMVSSGKLSLSFSTVQQIQIFLEKEQTVFNNLIKNVAEEGGAIYYQASNILNNNLIIDKTQFSGNKAYPVLPTDYDVTLSAVMNEAVLEVELSGDPYRRKKNWTAETLIDIDSSEPCHPGGGGAVCLVLNTIPDRAAASVEFSRSSFTANQAEVGGALLIASGRTSHWIATCPTGAIGSDTDVLASRCRGLGLRDLVFIGNIARVSGGAVFTSNLTHVYYSPTEKTQDAEHYITLDNFDSRENFRRNRLEQGTHGHDIAGAAVRLTIIHPKRNRESDFLFADQSFRVSTTLPYITVAIFDGLGRIVDGGITDSQLTIIAEAFSEGIGRNVASGQTSVIATNGIANFTALSLNAEPGVQLLKFSVLRENVVDVSANVTIRECSLGEHRPGFICKACQKDTFVFFSNASRCTECPAHAKCSGKASLVPAAGYWHSGFFSVIMHRCFHEEACDYKNRSEKLESFRKKLKSTEQGSFDVNSPDLVDEEYKQCADGYTGPLCGSCDEGYGYVEGKLCTECVSKMAFYMALFSLAVGQFLVMGLTLRGALNSIRDMNELHVIADHQATAAKVSSESRLRARAGSALFLDVSRGNMILHSRTSLGVCREEHAENPVERIPTIREIVAEEQTARDGQLRGELIVASQHISEIVKIFINFLQVTSVAGSIDLGWTASMKFILNLMAAMSGFIDRATFAPVACLLDREGGDQSIYGVIVRIALHSALLLVLVSFIALKRLADQYIGGQQSRRPIRSMASTIVLCFLVVVFFGYQSVSEDLMGTVSCIKLDDDKIDDVDRVYTEAVFGASYSQFSTARGWYWTQDTAVKCWSDSHRLLAFAVGIPGIVLFLCGVPLWLFVLLLVKRSKQQLLDIGVLNTYGFIYQNYVDQFVYWEVLIMMRKALMGAVIVFAYRLEPNLQGVLALGILIVSLSLQLIAAPFRFSPMNKLEGTSLIVSILTVYMGIVFCDSNTSNKAEVVLSFCLIGANVSFMIVVFVAIFIYLDRYATVKLQLLDCIQIPSNFLAKLRMVLLYKSWEVRDAVRSFARELRGRVYATYKSNAKV